jgi:L-ascorbate metabolism protein UlaG (beta-lactamase superfamily)
MKIKITHSTTACVLIEIGDVEHGGGLRILTDPVFDSADETYPFLPFPLSFFFEARRTKGPALSLLELPPHKPLDLILLSHAHHGDNLDHAGEGLLYYAREVITSVRGKEHLRYKVPATGLKPWATTTHFSPSGLQIRITATPAHHRPAWLPEGHEVVGFLIEWDAQPGLEAQENGAIYISGDTVYFDGIAEFTRRYAGKIGTALLHLGAVKFRRLPIGHYTFNGSEAARTAAEVGAKQIIPLHYEEEIWDHFAETRESYNQAFADKDLTSKVLWLEPGKPTEITV